MKQEKIVLPKIFGDLDIDVSHIKEKTEGSLYRPLGIEQVYGLDKFGHLIIDPSLKRPSDAIAQFDSVNIGHSDSMIQNPNLNPPCNLGEEQLNERFSMMSSKIDSISDENLRRKFDARFQTMLDKFSRFYKNDGSYPTPQKVIDVIIAERTNQFVKISTDLSENETVERFENGLVKPSKLIEQGKFFDDDVVIFRVLRNFSSINS